MADSASPADTLVATLGSGVRVAVAPLRHVATAAVSVFVRSGSQHESARMNGIGHFIEHMAFKGTRSRDCQQINLDAERLGAEVNAHTDQGHTAFHMRGLARDAGAFVAMLGDIVRHGTFPEHEIERERQVILHEYTEDEDDPMSTAFKLFDAACYGDHAMARPVIGNRANLRRFTREDLSSWVHQQYTGANIVVGVAGDVDADRSSRSRASFRRPAARQREPRHGSDVSRRKPRAPDGRLQSGPRRARLSHSGPARRLPERRRRRGAVRRRHELATARPDPREARTRLPRGLFRRCVGPCGQFVIEASTAPEHLHEYFIEVTRLLREHAATIDPVGLERARNQIIVRSLCAREAPAQRLEAAALDLFTFGRVREREEVMAGFAAVRPNRRARPSFACRTPAPPSRWRAGSARVRRRGLRASSAHDRVPPLRRSSTCRLSSARRLQCVGIRTRRTFP